MSEPTKGPERVWIRWTMGEALVAYTEHALGVEYLRTDAAREMIASEIEAEGSKGRYPEAMALAATFIRSRTRRPTPTETTTK